MPSETTESKEKNKKKKSLEGQSQGLKPSPSPSPKPSPTPATDFATAHDRTRGAWTEGGQRAATEEAVSKALVTEKVQPKVDTPERRAEAWAKANKVNFGLGGAPKFYRLIKEGKTPEEAARQMGLIK